MTFKDDAAADLDVFFNTDEFADVVEFNGAEVRAVKSGAGLEAYKTAEYTALRGTANRYMRLSVKTADMPEGVFISATVYIDGTAWKIEDMDDRHGITSFVLSCVEPR